jgi:fructosamine-3-kinase
MPLPEHAIAPLGRAVAAHLGRTWQATRATDLSDLACHPAGLFTDGAFGVFAKFSAAADARGQFEAEVAGLQLLSARGALTPAPIAVVEVEGGALLVLEAVAAVERGPRQWREMGAALARLHMVTGPACGLDRNGYFGPLYQDNRPLSDWPTFYAERRLWPYLSLAVSNGRLPSALVQQVERLIARLPELCGPPVAPALLHGDAQQNNFISSAQGAVLIDPAVHFGHPEFDLALVDYFQPVPEDLFAGYREVRPIDPGFGERRDLWRVAAWLACVAVDGDAYLGRLMAAVGRYG